MKKYCFFELFLFFGNCFTSKQFTAFQINQEEITKIVT